MTYDLDGPVASSQGWEVAGGGLKPSTTRGPMEGCAKVALLRKITYDLYLKKARKSRGKVL